MDTLLPVVIGSYALKSYGYLEEPSDIDLIVAESQADNFTSLATKKEGNICLIDFENKTHKVDLIPAKSDFYKFVSYLCNQQCHNNIVTLFGNIQAIIPSLEILYVIKKGHLHRILPLTGVRMNDIHIWYKHIKMYDWMRLKLGYKEMDMLLYGEKRYGTPLAEKSNLLQIFTMQFNEVIARIGDTSISMEKSNEDFFTDNVERFIEHDDLHKLVAQMCRNTDKVLYDLYKKNPTAANLEADLFLNDDQNRRNQCIYEEVMVLLLERKWIPEVMKCHVQVKVPIKSYDKKQKYEELLDVVAHFATNLCGQGHSWLRQYVIDHVSLWININAYDFDALYRLVLQITKADAIESNLKLNNLEGMLAKIAENDMIQEHTFSSYYGETRSRTDQLTFNSNTPNKELKYGDGEVIISYNCIHIDILENYLFTFKSKKDYSFYMKYIAMVLGGTVIFSSTDTDCWIYNADKKFGLIIDDAEPTVTLFYCVINFTQYHTISIGGEYYALDHIQKPESFGTQHTKRYTIYYYHSSDCEYNERSKESIRQYLSTYGTGIKGLDKLFETIARNILKIEADRTKRCEGRWSSGSESEEDFCGTPSEDISNNSTISTPERSVSEDFDY